MRLSLRCGRSSPAADLLKIGLTGGIGSGKSTVAARLAELGAVVVDADALAREVVAPGTAGLADVVAQFGRGVLTVDGQLDRAALGRIVFADDERRAALEQITHPRIAERTAQLVAQAPADAVVVHDVPLLVERGLAANYDLVVVVDAPIPLRLERLRERGMSEDEARARIAAQADESQRRAVADVYLDNSGTVHDLIERVDALWSQWSQWSTEHS